MKITQALLHKYESNYSLHKILSSEECNAHARLGMYTPEFNLEKPCLQEVINIIPIDFIVNRICDAGAGFGQSLMFLQKHFNCIEAIGVEYSAKAVELGNAIAAHQGVNFKLVQGLIEKYDYSRFDLIYSYHPSNCPDKQLELDRYILTSMKKGAGYLRVYMPRRIEELNLNFKLNEIPCLGNYNFACLYTK